MTAVKAVEANTDQPWVVLYVKRWLTAPLALPDGTLAGRDRGTPQGSAVSPVLANLFLHYAFDCGWNGSSRRWQFERYVDDAVVHCVTERQARQVWAALADRMAEVGLRLHPDKTKIVYCKDDNRLGSAEHTSFTFLGYQFRPRTVRSKHGRLFTAFAPAISPEALKVISHEVRRWRIHQRTGQISTASPRDQPDRAGLDELLRRFFRSKLHPLLRASTATWCAGLVRSIERLHRSTRLKIWWRELLTATADVRAVDLDPGLQSRQDGKSRVTGDCHARFCGSRGVRFPPATRLDGPRPGDVKGRTFPRMI